MKIIYVIDTISNLNNKINLLKDKLGNEIYFVVKADLVDLFKTYNYQPNAIYYNNLTKIIQSLLLNVDVDDIIICYASLNFDRNLLNKFISNIGAKDKLVSVMPKYNMLESACNSVYNVYVKTMFKLKDSLVSPKLQFIPSFMAVELMSSHLGNRLFEIENQYLRVIYVENEESNKTLKVKTPWLTLSIISILITLVLTAGLLASIAYLGPSYISIFLFVICYMLNIILTIIFLCKAKFDKRFLK